MGSTIFSVGTNAATTAYTITISGFGTTGASMVGMQITANYSNSTSATCAWIAAGTCTVANSFAVSYPAAQSTNPTQATAGTNWTITNNNATVGVRMTSITFNGIPGLTGFDRCLNASNVPDDTNVNCTGQGTAGSQVGWSVGNGVTTLGTSGIQGSVVYSNPLHLSAATAVGDLWGSFTITFSGTNFNNGNTFTFQSDSDTLTTATADVVATPEPSTFGLAGFALVALGLIKRKRR